MSVSHGDVVEALTFAYVDRREAAQQGDSPRLTNDDIGTLANAVMRMLAHRGLPALLDRLEAAEARVRELEAGLPVQSAGAQICSTFTDGLGPYCSCCGMHRRMHDLPGAVAGEPGGEQRPALMPPHRYRPDGPVGFRCRHLHGGDRCLRSFDDPIHDGGEQQ